MMMMAGVGWKVGRRERGSKGGGAVTMGTTGGGDQDAQQGAAGWLAGWVADILNTAQTRTHDNHHLQGSSGSLV